ncbi:MAG TPA: type II secretion system F family protein [Galbitalea sp.]
MKPADAEIAAIAAVVQRLAVLLAAGISPVAAWGYLGDDELPAQVAARCRSGVGIPDAIVAASSAAAPRDRVAWRGLATAWAVATEVGAPLAPTLRAFASSLRDLAQAQREITVALAAPIATARLVLALPAVGILFGMLLGFDTLGTLFTTTIGWGCLVIGVGLMVGATRWNRRLVRLAQPRDLTPGLGFDLLAIAVSGGGSLERAQTSVATAIERFALDESISTGGTDEVLDLSRRAGIPAAELLRSEADESRRRARAEVSARAQALSIRLMIPLGVCVLPAFMILSVVPLLVSVLRETSVPG